MMAAPGATFRLCRRVAPLAFVWAAFALGGCASVATSHGVHFVVTLEMRYGQSMPIRPFALHCIDFGLGPGDAQAQWLVPLEHAKPQGGL